MQAAENAVSTTEVFPLTPSVYTVEFLLSLRELPFCRQKPTDLPDLIDKDKGTDPGPGKGIRKQRRPGPNEEGDSQSYFDQGTDGGEYFGKGKGKGGKGTSVHNSGWQQQQQQSFSHQAEEQQSVGLPRNPQGRIIPGKGVPRKSPEPPAPKRGGPVLPSGGKWDHQPALANVVSRQQQGMTGSTASVAKGLDAFCMGDIRQAEKFIEGGLGLDEYAKKLASGEISAAANVESSNFFATDEEAEGLRPWERGAPRIIPGFAAQRPPPPASNAPIGKESNVAGLALLQMLVDRKAAAAAKPAPAPRQLNQQQINDLIAMSKKEPARIIPGQQPARQQPAAPIPPNAQVTALLEQLHRQQQAQRQAVPQTAPQAAYAPSEPAPQECQQQ